MGNTKTSNETLGITPVDVDYFRGVQNSGTSVIKWTFALVKAWIKGWLMAPQTISGTSYAILPGDKGTTLSFTATTAIAASVDPATFGVGSVMLECNGGSNGNVTITPASGTITWNGVSGSTFIVLTGQGIDLRCDGTNFTVGGSGYPADTNLAITDVTTRNVSTSKHGFAPKAPNDATRFLNGVAAYAVPTGIAPVNYLAGNWFSMPGFGSTATSSALVAGTYYCVPFYVTETITVSALGLVVVAPAGHADVAIFSNDPAANRPLNLLGNVGSIDCSGGAGAVFNTFAAGSGSNVQLSVGVLYWMVTTVDATAGGALTVRGFPGANLFAAQLIGSSNPTDATAIGFVLSNGSDISGVTTTGNTFGTWANFSGPPTWTEQNARSPAVAYKVASVP